MILFFFVCILTVRITHALIPRNSSMKHSSVTETGPDLWNPNSELEFMRLKAAEPTWDHMVAVRGRMQ